MFPQKHLLADPRPLPKLTVLFALWLAVLLALGGHCPASAAPASKKPSAKKKTASASVSTKPAVTPKTTVASPQTAPPQEKDDSTATLDETLDWLSEKIDGDQIEYDSTYLPMHNSDTFKIRMAPGLNYTLELTINSHYGKPGEFGPNHYTYEIHTYKIPLFKMQHVATRENTGYSILLYEIPILTAEMSYKLGGFENGVDTPIDSSVRATDWALLKFTDPDLANRVAKALNHAFNLCKGKQETAPEHPGEPF